MYRCIASKDSLFTSMPFMNVNKRTGPNIFDCLFSNRIPLLVEDTSSVVFPTQEKRVIVNIGVRWAAIHLGK